MSEERVQQLIDKQEIHELMAHYAERIDAKDPAGAAACFATDGIGVYWGNYEGPEAIAERLTAILDQFTVTSHHLSNVQIKRDGERATAMSYVYSFHRLVGNDEPMHYWGRWIDALRKDFGRWHFTHREVVDVGRVGTEEGDPASFPDTPGGSSR